MASLRSCHAEKQEPGVPGVLTLQGGDACPRRATGCCSGTTEGVMSSRPKLVLILVLAAAASVFAAPASALDGEVLIDQAKVNAGGITPGDEPGFPVTLSRRGKYKLTGNLN